MSKTGKMERRAYNFTVEKRDDETKKLIGHAAVFDTIGDGGFFREKISPGAFTKSIQSDDVRALFNHDSNYVLGRNTAGTLKLSEDQRGLVVEIDPPDTQWARDLLTSIERGDISQMSFGFETIKDSWERGAKNEPDLRTLEEVKLWDVSPVTFPFYLETDIALRNREAWINEEVVNKPLKHKLLKDKLNLKLKTGGL
jgi:HK97 family phage prohead protease